MSFQFVLINQVFHRVIAISAKTRFKNYFQVLVTLSIESTHLPTQEMSEKKPGNNWLSAGLGISGRCLDLERKASLGASKANLGEMEYCGKLLTSTRFGQLASQSLQLFSTLPKVFAFVSNLWVIDCYASPNLFECQHQQGSINYQSSLAENPHSYL